MYFCFVITVASNLPNAQLSGELLFNCVIANEPNRLIETLATARNGLEYKDRFANTPLLVAAYLGHANCVRILLQYGANYKRINCYGMSTNLLKFGSMFCFNPKLYLIYIVLLQVKIRYHWLPIPVIN